MPDERNATDANDALEQCEEALEELKEENAQLRESARAFGDLAERLNARRQADPRGRRDKDSPKL